MPRELKSPQDPSRYCTSWRYNSPEFPPFLCFENLPRPKNPAFCASWTSNKSNVKHLCASATSHLPHYFAFGNPKTVAAWKWNHLSFWRFSLCRSKFCPIWGQSLRWGRLWFCWFFSCFVGISAVVGAAQTHRVLLDTHYGPFYTPKTLRFKGKCPIVTQKKPYKTWKQNKRTNGQCTHVFQRFCAPGTHTI